MQERVQYLSFFWDFTNRSQEKYPWSKKELEVITIQRENMVQIPELPGSYFVSRCIDNAFRSVIYSGKNAREELEKQNDNISLEIKRKRTELKLD